MHHESQGKLDIETIASAVDATEAVMRDAGVVQSLSRRATILLEEVFLRYRERFGEDAEVTFSLTKRLGTVRMRAEVIGPQYNALDAASAGEQLGDEHDFISVLMESEFEPPSYTYRHGRNVVTLSARVQKQRPFWENPMLLATVLAVLVFFGLSRVSQDLATTLSTSVATPIVSMLMGVLSAITGPLLSLSLVSGICALGDVATLKGMGKHAVLRIMAWVVLLFVVSVVASTLFYHGAAGQAKTAFDPNELFELLLSAIPSNLFSPFVEGNSLQIAVESVFVGVCLLALGDRSALIKKFVIELNSLAFKMMHLFSASLPLLVGLSIFKVLATTDVSSLATMGMIVAIVLGIVGLVVAGTLLWVRATLRVSPSVFLRKLAPALFICLATGSTTSSMSEFFRISEEELGIDKKVVDFWVPLGHAMFVPSVIVPLVVGMYAISNMEGVAFGPTRVAVLFLLVFQLSIATPKVPGGIAATFTILLGQLGLPLDSVGILMAANVFMCNPTIAFGAFVRFAEICSFAKSEHALDADRLRASS